MKEYWIEVKGHPRYMVSTMGRVKCVDYRGTGNERICKLSVNSNGYFVVWIDGVVEYVHRLVATAFIPNPNPERNCIDHRNTIKTDNFVILDDDGKTVIDSNLRWVTHKENDSNPLSKKHRSENNAKHWLGKFGSEHNASIPIVQLTLDGQFIRRWPAAMEVQRGIEICRSCITACCKGKQKTAGGFRWVYASNYQKHISDINPLF